MHSQVWEIFLATDTPLKLMKSAFYFTSKALFVLKIFKFLSWLFDHVGKWLDKKDMVNFKFYDVTACTYCPILREVKAIRQWNLVS